MSTKLAINLSEGTIQVEGDEEFVRLVYQDFKESLGKNGLVTVVPSTATSRQEPQLLNNRPAPDPKADQPKKAVSRRKIPSSNSEKTRVSHKPKFNAKLDLTGLADFYDEWKPGNNPEKILVFAVFLRDRLQISPCNSDDIYTCFFTMKSKTKIPEAFQQAFINTKHRTHFIEFETTDSVEVTIAGENWFTEQAKKLKELPT